MTADPAALERYRQRSRRPLTAEEIPFAEAMGAELRRARVERGMSTTELGACAEISRTCVWMIETARRRTRRSTLERICWGLAPWIDDGPDQEYAENLLARLVEIGEPAIAPESKYTDRVERRRKRRLNRKRKEIEKEMKERQAREVRARKRAAMWAEGGGDF